ncbi:MAG: hypothetical protein JST92_16865, partial [Deltaproteobacteria bacterium]|nr:hypothetical protein [Deltaproteobacteria bacterium]
MTTLIRNCTLAAAVFTSFAATAGNTVSVTAVSTADGAPISTDSGGHALIGFNGVQLEVDYAVSTLPAGQQAYIRALICDPFEDPAKMIYDWSTLQQSDANLTAADDSSCDGGLHFGTGYAISSPPATPGAQGIIGTERFALRMPPWVIPPGTLATVPVQLLSTDGTVLATASVTMANNSDPWWLSNQGLDVVDQAPQPDHSTNVTFRHWYGTGSYLPPTVRTNVYTPLDGGHIVSVQWTGPTSDQEFIDSQTWHTFWPRLMAQHPDTAPSTGAYGLDVAAP